MHCSVTGGAGFIGSHFVDHVVGLGGQVVVVDDGSGGVNNLPTDRSVEFIEKNFRTCEARHFAGGFDALLHLAALPSVVTSWEQPMQAHELNLSLTLHAITLASELRIKRIVLAVCRGLRQSHRSAHEKNRVRRVRVLHMGYRKADQ